MPRLLALLIVIFWLTMTALLVRDEFGMGAGRLREVPMTHVMRLLFKHEQSSGLNILSEKQRIGHVRIDPQVSREDGARLFKFSGNLQIPMPRAGQHRVWWDGAVEMTRMLEVQAVKVGVSFREPAVYRVEIAFAPQARTGHYEVRSGDRVLEQHDFSLDEKGVRDLLRRLEIDPEIVKMIGSQAPTDPPEIGAFQSSLDLHGTRVDTFLVTVRQNGQTLAEVHVSQLGRVLRAATFLGYTLLPEELQP